MKQIWLVDDEKDFLELMELKCPKEWNLKTFQSSEQALEMLANVEPTVIISDVTMPGMNGVDFFRVASLTVDSSRVVLISANSREQVEESFGKLRETDKLYKKPLGAEFFEAIDDLFQRANDGEGDGEDRLRYTEANLSRLKTIAKALFEHQSAMRLKYDSKPEDYWDKEDLDRLQKLEGNLSVSKFVLNIEDDQFETILRKWVYRL